jgi:small subunit ribosomal protein S6
MSNLLKYDVIYILDPGATPEESTAVSAKIEQIVADAKGTILKKDDWGKRRLAYAVKKHRDGHYVFFHVSVTPETVAEITRNLRLLEKVIKFTVVKDTISHLKAKVKPPRTPRPEGSSPRPGAPRHLSHSSSHSSGSHSSGSSHSSSAPAASAPVSSAPAPKAPESPAAPSTGSTSSPQATTNP